MAAKLIGIHSLDYRNLILGEQGFEPHNLSILIGPNGCGKSNLFALLQFLRDALIDTPNSARTSTPFEQAIHRLGGPRILATSKKPQEMVHLAFFFETDLVPKKLDYYISLHVDNTHVILGEEYLKHLELATGQTEKFTFFSMRDHSFDTGGVSVINTAQQTIWVDIHDCKHNELGLRDIPRLLETSGYPPKNIPIYSVRRELLDNTISKWQFYNANDMNLSAIRSASPRVGLSDDILSSSGENLVTVLHNLFQKNINFEEVMQYACRSFIPQTKRLRTITSHIYLGLEWYIDRQKDPFFLSDMSDGTVRMLCWAVILKSPNPPPLLIIDEPEMGLHVSWMPILAQWIKEASVSSQVIVATHSSDLLDHFTDMVENVHCFRHENNGLFSIRPLSSDRLKHKIEDEKWFLGDLYRTGDPDVGGWPW